jgi:hypothetical protein
MRASPEPWDGLACIFGLRNVSTAPKYENIVFLNVQTISMTESPSPNRRALLGAVVSTLGAGCTGYFDDGPNCPFEVTPPDDSLKTVERFSAGVTSNNQRQNGSCRRSTATVCVQATIRLTSNSINHIKARNKGGEVVADKTANETEVYLELAELSRGETGSYTIHFIRDGESIGQGGISVDCRTE